MTAQPMTQALVREQPSSVSKVLAVLTAMLQSGQAAVGLTEIALAVGQPKSTTHRLLKELDNQGFVDRAGNLYRLGDAFLDIADTARRSRNADLRDVAYPSLARLFEESEAVAVHLAVLRGRSIQYVDKVMRAEGVRLPTRVGGRFPAACTGLGKALLSAGPPEALQSLLAHPLPRATPFSVTAHAQLLVQLHRAREAGFVVESEEACHGFVCIAAPIVSQGRPVAAVSIVIPTLTIGRSGPRQISRLGQMVSRAAEAIGERLLPEVLPGEVPTAGTAHSLRGRARIDSRSSQRSTTEEL